MNVYSSYNFSRMDVYTEHESLIADSVNAKNDTTIVTKDSVKTRSKKKEYNLEVTFYVKDFLTHLGIDSVEAEILLAADSSFVDSAKVSLYNYDNKVFSAVEGNIKKPGDYIFRLRANGYRTLYHFFLDIKIS